MFLRLGTKEKVLSRYLDYKIFILAMCLMHATLPFRNEVKRKYAQHSFLIAWDQCFSKRFSSARSWNVHLADGDVPVLRKRGKKKFHGQVSGL